MYTICAVNAAVGISGVQYDVVPARGRRPFEMTQRCPQAADAASRGRMREVPQGRIRFALRLLRTGGLQCPDLLREG
jgi:hypothetical protein